MTEKRIIFCQDLIPKVLDWSKRVTRRCHTKLRYQPGDVIYLAEPIMLVDVDGPLYDRVAIVRKCGDDGESCEWFEPPEEWQHKAMRKNPRMNAFRSGRYMPKWAARPWRAQVTEAGFVQLQDITVEEIIREGLSSHLRGHDACCDLKEQWISLWDKLNGKRPGWAWEDNPRVARYAWEPVE